MTLTSLVLAASLSISEMGGGKTETAGDEKPEAKGKKSHRRVKACEELSQKYIMQRCWSEVNLLESMQYKPLKSGLAYHFITGGDVDSLSFLKVVLNQQRALDYLLCSTWVISAEDMLQVRYWYEEGRIKHLDMYLGEIFPNQYKIEWGMVQSFYNDYPEAGRVAVFRNHCKVYAGYNEAADFYFGIQTSANANTNPRIEQASIITERVLYEFYREFFDGIKSFVKDEKCEEVEKKNETKNAKR